MGGEGVLQLARHRGRPTDCVRWVTHTEFFVCEDESTATASLQEQTREGFFKENQGQYYISIFNTILTIFKRRSLMRMYDCMPVVSLYTNITLHRVAAL